MPRQERLVDLKHFVSDVIVNVSYEKGAYAWHTPEWMLTTMQTEFDLTEEEVAYLWEYVCDDMDDKVNSLKDEIRDLLECAVDQLMEDQEKKLFAAD